MTDTKTSGHRFRLVIELLEELHTGCGTGSAVVDRALARDLDDRPVIPRSHLQGIWRDHGERLCAIGAIGGPNLMTADQWRNLFGSPGGQRGCLIAPELKPIAHPDTAAHQPASPPTVDWNATARRTGSRVPDDHSLRRTEYLPAGTHLAGIGYLNSDDQQLIDAFRQVLRVTDRLGSERSRGSGLIRKVDLCWLDATPPLAPAAPSQSATGLRLLLRAVSPVCIPATGFPGNIIPSETHIPGRMLFGSLARYALDQGQYPTALFARRVRIGPAYPLPPQQVPSDAAQLAAMQVLPIPLCLHTPKPGLGKHKIWPHWAGGTSPDEKTGPIYVDRLAPATEDDATDQSQDQTRLKRPKPHAYLFNPDRRNPSWSVFNAAIGLRMRNSRGTSLKDIDEKETALFTVEQIPAGTCFIADVHADATQDLQDLRRTLFGLLDGPSGSEVLRIGRGGAPIELAGWCWLEGPQVASDNDATACVDATPNDPGQHNTNPLRITLTTDTIIRDPLTLGFHSQLSAAALSDALDLDPPNHRQGQQRRYSDAQRYIGFNATSGLPMTPKIAIRRGSTLRIAGSLAATLRSRLADRDSIGERCWEGSGRFLLDFAPATSLIGELPGVARDPGQASRLAAIGRRERLLAQAESYAASLAAAFAKDSNKGKGLTRSQIGNLRGVIAALPQQASYEQLHQDFTNFAKHVARRRDGGTWSQVFAPTHGLLEALGNACREATDVKDDADLFLRELRRHALPDDET